MIFMDKNTLLDAVSDIDISHVEDHIKMREKLKKRPRRLVIQCAAAALALYIVLVSAFTVLSNGKEEPPGPGSEITDTTTDNKISPPSIDEVFDLPVDADDIIWYVHDPGVPIPEPEYFTWNEFYVTWEFTWGMSKAEPSSYLAITANTRAERYGDGIPDDYIIEGEYYADIRNRAKVLKDLCTKFDYLKSEGDLLKYGEALYTTGTPDGDLWDKEYYDERVAYYGELLEKYIVNGKFLIDDVMSDDSEATQTLIKLNRLMSQAYEEYVSYSINDLYTYLSEKGYCTINILGTLYIFIQKAEFEKLEIDKKGYEFSLSSREAFEADSICLSVKGFDIEKFKYPFADKATSDKEVIENIFLTGQVLIPYNSIHHMVFIFYCNEVIPDDAFADIEHHKLERSEDGLNVYITLYQPNGYFVPYDPTEYLLKVFLTLKELSLSPNVNEIEITLDIAPNSRPS